MINPNLRTSMAVLLSAAFFCLFAAACTPDEDMGIAGTPEASTEVATPAPEAIENEALPSGDSVDFFEPMTEDFDNLSNLEKTGAASMLMKEAKACIEEGSLDAAERKLKMALCLIPDDWEVWFALAWCYRHQATHLMDKSAFEMKTAGGESYDLANGTWIPDADMSEEKRARALSDSIASAADSREKLLRAAHAAEKALQKGGGVEVRSLLVSLYVNLRKNDKAVEHIEKLLESKELDKKYKGHYRNLLDALKVK